MCFVDTNVLLYAVSPLSEEIDKRRRAWELLEQPDLAISVQVLLEFYHQAIPPTGPAQLTPGDALDFLEPILELPVQPLTADLFLDAVAISRRFQMSYWDVAILAAARALGCDAVYSEVLSAQQNYDDLRVINPFREGAKAL